jgi:hypothetical protein
MTKPHDITIPPLSECEQLQLQNIMLKMALAQTSLEKQRYTIDNLKHELAEYQTHLTLWKQKFNDKLKAIGLDITQVTIDAETGKITLEEHHE